MHAWSLFLYEKIIPFHDCTEADWAEFPPPSKSSTDSWNEIKNGTGRGMFCLDYSDDVLIYGNEKNEEYQRLEIVLVPCNYQHTQWGYTGDSIYSGCESDLKS